MGIEASSPMPDAEQDATIVARTSAPKSGAGMNVITLKVTLRGTKPPIWRRLVMPGTMTLGDLHQAIQAAMGWHDGHLHAFTIGGEQFGDRHSVDDVADENRVTLNGLLRSPVVRFAYTSASPTPMTSATIGSTRSHSKKASRWSRAYHTPSASLESATVRQRIAAVSGAMRRCWPS